MKKFIIFLIIGIVIIGATMITNAASPTKIPYDNGFYAGPYNPKLPKIDPIK